MTEIPRVSERARIVHISDPHFGTTTPEKISALRSAIHEIDPQLVLLSGDITQRATSTQFFEAKAFVDSLKPLEVFVVPGNHDISLLNVAKRFLNPYGGYKSIFGGQLSHRWQKGAIEVLAINSTSRFRHTQGDLLAKDLRELGQFSDQARVRLVMFHHPVDCAKEKDLKNLLKNAEGVIARFEEEHVDMVLGGHVHDPLARLSDRRYQHVARPMIVSVAGTCLSSRTRSGAPNSFNFIDVTTTEEKVSIRITRYDLRSIDMTFAPCLHADFERVGGLWREIENPVELRKL